MIEQAIMAGAKWVGKYSKELDTLLDVARQSGIAGLVEKMNEIKRQEDEQNRIAAEWC